MKFFALYIILFGVFIISSCNNTKYLPEGEALYTGSKIKVVDSVYSKKKKKAIKEQVEDLTRPKPNKTILGLRIKLYAYNIAGKNRTSEKGLFGWLKFKFGEPPVLMSSVNLGINEQILANHLENKGFFQAAVKGDTVVKRKKGEAIYTVVPGVQYTINEVKFDVDSSDLKKAIVRTERRTLLKKGDPYDLDVIKAERERIDTRLKNKGFYYFNQDFIIVDVDSTIGKNQVNMYVRVKTGTPAAAKEIYRINDIFIYPSYRLNNVNPADTTAKNAFYYKGYYVVDRKHLYKPQMFERAMLFKTDSIYNRRDHNQTLQRLTSLGLFKFVKNRFEDAPNVDSPKLNTYYYLTPYPKKSVNTEIAGTTKSNDLTGSQITIAWKNRNTFKGGELFTIKTYGGFEIQYGGQFNGYNTFRYGIEGTLSFPQFIVPVFKLNTSGGYVPKTNITLGYDWLNKQKQYTLNSFRVAYGYVWKETLAKEHQLYPISVNYVQPINVTQQYRDSAENNVTLQKAIEKQFILGSTYSYTYNTLLTSRRKDGLYFRGGVDLSGNIVGLFTKNDIKNGDTAKIFNAPFSQYARFDADFRIYHKIGTTTIWANRIFAGVGFPYKNSSSLPYVKQFFAGGNNSLRGFRSRSVGPGSYIYPDTSGFYPDQSGDIRLELNTELRAKLFSIVYGAVFVDAGNIWLYNENPAQPGGKFTKHFLNDIAVNTGFGLRFDVSILVLRLDLGIPLRKPWYPDGQKWVLDQIDLGNSQWRKDNLVLNIAIGYPF
ncbi:translocation and assembly module lipoprotein TamL [Pinibacter aurantiacus]|uniref:BamA/TamA family outer membrane protein n=1 Tax=Pinibacter aurantiacus TaxID=2851599 RepID=A0A9E2W930_9BACT|nr:BamA/TamA family outer membrane protein [Pinibacter aurantiacus]MBV4359461.1 BamA/TamA family outer membrane protein [Pinibacter aurantiacus]